MDGEIEGGAEFVNYEGLEEGGGGVVEVSRPIRRMPTLHILMVGEVCLWAGRRWCYYFLLHSIKGSDVYPVFCTR